MNWYKKAMFENQVGNETVCSENNRLIGAAVKYRNKVFVDSCHPLAWMIAQEDPELGEEITDVFDAGQRGIVDLDRFEGFMTTSGFKTRLEAKLMAEKSGQLKHKVLPGRSLQSEDIKEWAPKESVKASILESVFWRDSSNLGRRNG